MNWNRFLEEWGRPYEDARHILQYLRSYPDILASLDIGDVSDPEEMDALFYRVQNFGLTEQDKEMVRTGAEYVKQNHTWTHRLEEIMQVIGQN